MNRNERIIAILSDHLSPSQLEVIDDSAKHAGHAGAKPEGETHYTVRIRSEILGELPRVAQHQAIYRLLDKEFQTGLHALAIEVIR